MDHALRRGLAVAALVPLLTGIAACGDSGSGKAKDAKAGSAASQSCGTLPTADPSATLPSAFPALTGQLLYEPSTQGKTKIVYGLVGESDFAGVRDEIAAKLKAAHYTIVGTDQESVEAEAEFRGPQSGTIKVQPLCKGYTTVRYKLLG